MRSLIRERVPILSIQGLPPTVPETHPRLSGGIGETYLFPCLATCFWTKIGLIQISNEVSHEITQSDQADQLREGSRRRNRTQYGDQMAPLVITQNGEAKVVLQDSASYEQTQQTMALLKILTLGNRQIETGKVEPAAVVIQRLREQRSDR